VNVGIEDLLNLPFDMVTDEDELAGGTKVVCSLDEDCGDELFREVWKGSEFEEVRMWGSGV